MAKLPGRQDSRSPSACARHYARHRFSPITNGPFALDRLAKPDRVAMGGSLQMSSNRMRRGLVVGGVAVVAVLAIGGAFALLLGSHQAPGRLGLSSLAASRPASSLTGEWKGGRGSEAGYPVSEQFINQPGPTQAGPRPTKIPSGP